MAFTPEQQAKMNALRSIVRKKAPLPVARPMAHKSFKPAMTTQPGATPTYTPGANPGLLTANPGMLPAPTNITNTQQALNNQANVNQNDENELLGS